MRLAPKTTKLLVFFALFFLVTAFAVAQLIQEPEPIYSALEKAFYLSAQDAVWTRPGLKLTIQNVAIGSDRKAVVTYRITDNNGIAIDREGKYTPGTVASSFILAYIPKDATQYVAYTTRVQTSPITKVSATQAGTDPSTPNT